MKTKRAFDRKGRRIGYNFGLNFNSEEFTFKKTCGPAENRELQVEAELLVRLLRVVLQPALRHPAQREPAPTPTPSSITFNVGYNRDPTAADPRPLVIRQIDFKDGPKWILQGRAAAHRRLEGDAPPRRSRST